MNLKGILSAIWRNRNESVAIGSEVAEQINRIAADGAVEPQEVIDGVHSVVREALHELNAAARVIATVPESAVSVESAIHRAVEAIRAELKTALMDRQLTAGEANDLMHRVGTEVVKAIDTARKAGQAA